MQIAGIQKMTLVDFPGHVAATVFTRGCSFRCPFCHNPELVLPEKYNTLLSEKQILDFLESRYGKLNGICITGGEPCLQSDVDKFISYLKALGFDVKLDTNGSFPDRLEKVIEDGDVDYIAMDIKNSLSKYPQTVIPNSQFLISNQTQNSQFQNIQKKGVIPDFDPESHHADANLTKNIKRSIKLIMDSGIDYEFRTTVCHPLHEVKDFEEIGKLIKGAKRYFIQNYQHSKQVDEESEFRPYNINELNNIKRLLVSAIKEVKIR